MKQPDHLLKIYNFVGSKGVCGGIRRTGLRMDGALLCTTS